jgi:hypothetical protein
VEKINRTKRCNLRETVFRRIWADDMDGLSESYEFFFFKKKMKEKSESYFSVAEETVLETTAAMSS